jgi:hypothetical protein
MQYLVVVVHNGQQTPHVECTAAIQYCQIICRDFSELLILSVPV